MGCSKAVSVPQTSYGLTVDGGTGEVDYTAYYKNQNMTVSSMCMYQCDKAYQYELPLASIESRDNYSMPKSNKLELTLGVKLIIQFNRDGNREQIGQRLKYITDNYRPKIYGDPTDNQVFLWDIDDILTVVLPSSKYKSIIRENINDMTITEAFDAIGSFGPVTKDIEDDIRQHLKNEGDLFRLVRIEYPVFDLPKEVKDKNSQEYNLDAQARIQTRQLAMTRARVTERHLLNMQELTNEIEMLNYVKPMLTKEVLVYKWQQWANNAVENGIPVAIDPAMLNPAVSEIAGEAFDYDALKETLERRKKEISREVERQQRCAENTDGCK